MASFYKFCLFLLGLMSSLSRYSALDVPEVFTSNKDKCSDVCEHTYPPHTYEKVTEKNTSAFVTFSFVVRFLETNRDCRHQNTTSLFNAKAVSNINVCVNCILTRGTVAVTRD